MLTTFGIRRPFAATVLWAALALLSGCRPPSQPGGYVVQSGTIEALRTDSSELTLRTTAAAAGGRAKSDSVACLLTNDSEIYLNDRVVPIGELEAGDSVELIGYFESQNPRSPRFVVSQAFVHRDEPPPPDPIVLDPNAAPRG